MAKPAFTPTEKKMILRLNGKISLTALHKLVPGRTKRQISNFLANSRRPPIAQSEIIPDKKPLPVFKLTNPEAATEEAYQDYNIPLLGKGIITEDIYAFRNGYLLTTESRTSGSGVLESQSVRLKAA